jgi:CotH kinase protein
MPNLRPVRVRGRSILRTANPMRVARIEILASLIFCTMGAEVGCSTRLDSGCATGLPPCAPDAGSDASDASDAGSPGTVLPEPEDEARYIFDQSTVRTYDLTVSEADLAMIDANPAAEQNIRGMLEFEGNHYGPLGIRYKGSVGAWNPPCTRRMGGQPAAKSGKCSIKVSFDYVDDDARFYGVKKLNFHAMNRDVSMLRDRLGYSLFREMGVAAPRAVHARLLINGRLEGLFVVVEQVDGRFTRSRFGEGGQGNLYKEIWPIHDDPSAYVAALETNRGDSPSVEGMLAFKHAVDLGADAILDRLDRDYMLRYIAVDRVTINDDGPFHQWCTAGGRGNNPSGIGNHNYYWYEAARAHRFWLVPWDLDNSFDNRSLVHIASDWTAEGTCTCARSGQPAPSCDPLIRHWGTWRPDYEIVVDDFLRTAFSASNVDLKLASWTSQIEAAVEEGAGLNGAPNSSAWRSAVEQLRGKIDMARMHRGYPY